MNLLSVPSTRRLRSCASRWTLKQVQGDIGGRGNVTCHHKIRHPELVSGSIAQRFLSYRRHSQLDRQIQPMRIFGINQINFPRPMPILQLLLARNRGPHRAENLKMHQPVNCIFGGMSRRHTAAMLRNPFEQVRRYADVQRPIMLACKYIYARGFLVSHALDSAAKWTLKQVQGDVNGYQGDVNCYQSGVNFGKMFRMNSKLHTVTLNLFQGPSGNPKLTVRSPHD